MNLGGTVQLKDVAVTMVEATHSAAAEDEQGTHYVGVATGYVLAIEGGPTLYHSGDTNVFGDMKLIAQLYHPEVAMLPIGGYYTMGPKEAALAVELLKPKIVLPIHFGTFPPLKGTPKELASLDRSRNQSAVLQPRRDNRVTRLPRIDADDKGWRAPAFVVYLGELFRTRGSLSFVRPTVSSRLRQCACGLRV